MDETMDTLDTSVDIRALEDAGDFDDVDATEQIPALEPEELDITALNLVTVGMRFGARSTSRTAAGPRS